MLPTPLIREQPQKSSSCIGLKLGKLQLATWPMLELELPSFLVYCFFMPRAVIDWYDLNFFHCVHPPSHPPFLLEGQTSYQIFKKEGAWQDLNF